MTKRFICFLLAAALLACSAFAAAPETSPEPAQHKINISCDARFGSVKLDSQTGAFGDNIYFHVSATEGFVPENPKIATASGTAVQCYVADDEDGIYDYYFSMPDEDVTISLSFSFAGAPFDDVLVTDWFCVEVLRACSAGYMNGTGERSFSPNAPADRAMLVTVLWRIAGQPEPKAASSYSDVDASAYYAKAVAWAAENEIVNGYEDGSFRPADALTREQFAAILYRYAVYCGYDISASNSLSAYTDAGKVGSWALDAMKWAVGAGIVTGSGAATLAPQGTATRAQTAVMLVRFTDKF